MKTTYSPCDLRIIPIVRWKDKTTLSRSRHQHHLFLPPEPFQHGKMMRMIRSRISFLASPFIFSIWNFFSNTLPRDNGEIMVCITINLAESIISLWNNDFFYLSQRTELSMGHQLISWSATVRTRLIGQGVGPALIPW